MEEGKGCRIWEEWKSFVKFYKIIDFSKRNMKACYSFLLILISNTFLLYKVQKNFKQKKENYFHYLTSVTFLKIYTELISTGLAKLAKNRRCPFWLASAHCNNCYIFWILNYPCVCVHGYSYVFIFNNIGYILNIGLFRFLNCFYYWYNEFFLSLGIAWGHHFKIY